MECNYISDTKIIRVKKKNLKWGEVFIFKAEIYSLTYMKGLYNKKLSKYCAEVLVCVIYLSAVFSWTKIYPEDF